MTPTPSLGDQRLRTLQVCARMQASLAVRYACLTMCLAVEQASALNERLRVPTDCGELALLTAREHTNVHASGSLDAKAVMRLLERSDAFRRPERFLQMLAACECDAAGRLGFEDVAYPQRARLAAALKTAQEVDTRAVSAQAIARGLKGPHIADEIRHARVRALEAALD